MFTLAANALNSTPVSNHKARIAQLVEQLICKFKIALPIEKSSEWRRLKRGNLKRRHNWLADAANWVSSGNPVLGGSVVPPSVETLRRPPTVVPVR